MKNILSITIFILTFSTVLIAQINTEKFRQDSDSLGFSGNLDLSATLITGNTDFKLVSLGGRLNQNWGNSYTFLVLDGGLGWESGNRFVDAALAHLRNVVTISDLVQLEQFAQFDFNKKRLLLSRELIGGGIRLRILEEGGFKFRLGASYFFEHEEYDLPVNSIHPHSTNAHRFSNYITMEFDLEENVKLIIVSYIQPDITNLEDYRILNETGLEVSISKLIDVNFKFNLRYDNKPPDNIKNNDTISKFGITFNF